MAEARVNKEALNEIMLRIQDLFMSDEIPWVVGYSGGKDSSATLQLVWYALSELPSQIRNRKKVHVISTDTMVEQPVVAAWVSKSLELMAEASRVQDMPIITHRLTPAIKDTFWVNVIGKGYPAPRQTFRWCTSRLKIDPSNRFILDMVKTFGETILVLGTRKAESMSRAIRMERYEKHRIRQWLSPNTSLPNSWVFSPIEEWSNDDVWMYLLRNSNPWGRSNKDLLSMYRGASADNECPLVVDTSTPSCGNSRFGCWVCTLVSSDKSMQAMIQNDIEKQWMTPLLELRDEIGKLDEDGRIDDRNHRDFRRMNGSIKLKNDRAIHGPYTQSWREHLLKRLLEAEKEIHQTGPSDVKDIRLLTDDELREIRRLWMIEKHEFCDSVPRIYQEVTGLAYPFMDDIEPGPFGPEEWKVLEELCTDNEVYLQLQTSLLDIEQRLKSVSVKKTITKELQRVIEKCYYENEEDAVEFAKRLKASAFLIEDEPDEGEDCE